VASAPLGAGSSVEHPREIINRVTAQAVGLVILGLRTHPGFDEVLLLMHERVRDLERQVALVDG
jgi:hypothetical protein